MPDRCYGCGAAADAFSLEASYYGFREGHYCRPCREFLDYPYGWELAVAQLRRRPPKDWETC
jgi:hypothetical protein